jgi:alkylated DNA repair dioxygenase AlkB
MPRLNSRFFGATVGMNLLFPIERSLPNGFVYIEDFISKQEEDHLLEAASKAQLHPMMFQGYEAKRKVASYGYDWSFEKRSLTRGKEIPLEYQFLVQRVADHLSLAQQQIAELLVTEYPVGSVINWHRDAPPFDIIAGISLLSNCTFKLRPHDKNKQNRSATISLPVRRRSLYVMQGESRSEWEHATAPVKEVRYSITLRTLRNGPVSQQSRT